MFKKISEFIEKKIYGVDLIDGKIKAFEITDGIYIDKSIEEAFPNMIEAKDNNYWYDSNFMKQIVTYISSRTKNSFSSPILYIAIPSEITSNEDKNLIFKSFSKSRWGSIHMVNSFICGALGSGLDVNEFKRRIFVYCSNNLTYIGLVFAGGDFNVQIIKKKYSELNELDIENSIQEILNRESTELPEQFTNAKLSKKDLEELKAGWSSEIEDIIYLSVPLELSDKFSNNIGKYQVLYLNYENSIVEGLKKIISIQSTK